MSALLGGKYVLDRRLGGGGMAEVFLGYAVGVEGFRRPVAIKRVLPGYAESPQFADMFIAEARLSSQLQHANIVSVLDFVRDPEVGLFLVMEYVDGPSLDSYLQTGLLPIPAVVHVITEVLRGLEHAHEMMIPDQGIRGIVHRDVSPHNVLLSRDGGVKLADFGIAKARMTSNVTGSAVLKGKPAYMSPEQANGEPLDGRSDLFAVGVMLWEMLCGRPLFMGSSMQETLSRLLFAPILAPGQLRSDLPADLEHVTMRLLARERGQRYQTANAAMVDLIACRDHPRSGRELLRGLMRARFASDGTPGEIASGARTAVDARRPLPSPSEGRSPLASTGAQRGWRKAVLLSVVAVGVFGTALGLLIASRVNPPVRIITTTIDASVVDAASTITTLADASEQPPPVNVDAGIVEPGPGKRTRSRVASTPIDSPPAPSERATQPEVTTGTPAAEPPAEVPPSISPDLANDLARISKMGALLDFEKLFAKVPPGKTFEIDKQAVIKYWLARAPEIQRCYEVGLRSLRIESGKMAWWRGGSGVSYWIDERGVVTHIDCYSRTHEDVRTCLQEVVGSAKAIPRPSSGNVSISVEIYITPCITVWEQDDAAGRARRRCPAATAANIKLMD